MRRLVHAVRHMILLAAAIVAPPIASGIGAQGAGSISGNITSSRTGGPVSGAQITVEGQTVTAVSDAAGSFRLNGLTGSGEVTLSLRRVGYQAVTRRANIGATGVRIEMVDRAIELSQMVVTGTAGVAEKRAIGNAVSTVNAADIVSTQPVRNFQELLTGRAAGVSVIASSGQVGTGARIRIRGASSLSLPNDPLVYVDGIRVDNAQATGPSNQAFGSASISRWNDFRPEDIESLEIIKGPAAATLYGTEASNGVVQIITKKGLAGRPSWNITYRGGSSWIPNWLTRFPNTYGTIPRAGSATALDTVQISTRELNDSSNAKFGHDIFGVGNLQDVQLSVSGGSPTIRYYVGGGHEKNQGIERESRLNRSTFRANITVTPSTTWDVSSALAYMSGRTYLPYESGGGGATWATYYSSPSFLYNANRSANNPQMGFRSGPPDIYYAAYDIFQDADRFTGSLTITNRAKSWFNQRLILGVDRVAENNADMTPRNDIIGNTYASFSSTTSPTNGSISLSTRDLNYLTFDYLANVPINLTSSITSITSAGGQFYGRKSRVRGFSGSNFPAAGLTSIQSAAIRTVGTDSLNENNTVGGFIQQQFVFNNRLFLTGAIRTDDNSAFGKNFDAVTYPKVSASYVVSEEPALHIPDVVNQLRLRAAYGASGQQPGAFDAIRTYTAIGGFLSPSSAGNANLGPEKSTELELGFDAGLFNDRYGAEVTYYNGRTKDAILSRQSPPSDGFPGLQLFNAGEVKRHGLEWLLRAQPLNYRNLRVDLSLSGSQNNYEIESLGGNKLVSVSSNVAHVPGYAPGAWFDRRIVSATRNATTGNAENLLCDDGNGSTMPCATAPRVFLGNSVPRTEGSFSAGVTAFSNFRVNAFFDWRGGYKKLDGNFRTRCGAFVLCKELYYPRDEPDLVKLAAVQAGTAYTFHLLDDAGFTRLRELSATYTLPTRWANAFRSTRASVTVAGRNLALWTKFNGVEPESGFNGGTRGGQFGLWEQNVLPQPRQFVMTLNFSF